MNVAYTVGRLVSYKEAIRQGAKKLGRTNDYQGGWVWPTFELAEAGLKELLAPDFGVYKLSLPNGWDIDVSKEHANDADTAFYLLNDSVIECWCTRCEICKCYIEIDPSLQEPICEVCYGTEAYCNWVSVDKNQQIQDRIKAVLQVLADIADRYEKNGLDECRPEWVQSGLEVFDLNKELYCGRGGKALLKLQDVFVARDLLKEL